MTLSRRIAKAALLCVPFTIIAFQPVREDGYDPEKMGLIAIFVAVIAGAYFLDILKTLPSLSAFRETLVAALRKPLYGVVLAFLVVTIISTILSLSRSLSFWGETSRAQGLLSLLLYCVLFWQAARLDRGQRAALVPVLLMASIPVCLWQFVLFTQGVNRLLLGSSAGNPNFLSSWLVMVLVYCVPQLLQSVASWSRPFTIRRWLTLLFYAAIIIILMVSLDFSASRGALFGLLVGALFYIVVWCVMAGRRRVLTTVGVLLMGGAFIYGAVGVWAKSNAQNLSPATRDQVVRLFQPYDAVRLQIWDAASAIVSLQAQPMFAITRQPDSLTLLRPLVGYGPETVEQLQSRFGDIFGPNVAVNSFHNAIFDMLITQGWLGLVAWIALLESALFLGLRYLRIYDPTRHRIGQFAIWQGIGAVAGVLILSVLIAGSSIAALAPLGAALGAVAGLLLWIGKQGFASRDDSSQPSPMSANNSLVLAILAVLVAQWIDNLFGFTTGSTQPLFWILLGLLAGALRMPVSEDQVATEQPVEFRVESRWWYASGAIVGLFTLHSFGVLLRSQSFNVETGTAFLPFLLAAIFCIALIGGVLHSVPGKVALSNTLLWLGMMIAGWAAFLLIKTVILGAVEAALNAAVQANSATLSHDLTLAILPLAASGLIVVFGALVVMTQTIRQNTTSSHPLQRRVGPVIALCCGAACIFYAAGYTSGVLHNIGSDLMQRAIATPTVSQSKAPDVAVAALEAASSLVPSNAPLRLHWTSALASTLILAPAPEIASASREQITRLLMDIFRDEPYFVNTLEWRNFSNAFKNLLRN